MSPVLGELKLHESRNNRRSICSITGDLTSSTTLRNALLKTESLRLTRAKDLSQANKDGLRPWMSKDHPRPHCLAAQSHPKARNTASEETTTRRRQKNWRDREEGLKQRKAVPE